jgi:hypothetical protein
MTLERRVERLERQQGGEDAEPYVIIILRLGDEGPTEEQIQAEVARRGPGPWFVLCWRDGEGFK